MVDSVSKLRQKAALYRGYLAHGVSADLARLYLEEIAGIERQLADHERRAAIDPRRDERTLHGE